MDGERIPVWLVAHLVTQRWKCPSAIEFAVFLWLKSFTLLGIWSIALLLWGLQMHVTWLQWRNLNLFVEKPHIRFLTNPILMEKDIDEDDDL